MELAESSPDKEEAKEIRDRITAKLAKLSDNQTLVGVWIPKEPDSHEAQPRLEIRKGVSGALEARALGSQDLESFFPKGPWVRCTGDAVLRIENARYFTQLKDASHDGLPADVTFVLTRTAENKLEGTVSQFWNKIKTTYNWVFEREEPSVPSDPRPRRRK